LTTSGKNTASKHTQALTFATIFTSSLL